MVLEYGGNNEEINNKKGSNNDRKWKRWGGRNTINEPKWRISFQQ